VGAEGTRASSGSGGVMKEEEGGGSSSGAPLASDALLPTPPSLNAAVGAAIASLATVGDFAAPAASCAVPDAALADAFAAAAKCALVLDACNLGPCELAGALLALLLLRHPHPA
jgi:hypothetical protein